MLHSHHYDEALGEDGRRSLVPHQGIGTKGLNEIGLPENFSLEINGRKCTAFEVNKNAFSIGIG